MSIYVCELKELYIVFFSLDGNQYMNVVPICFLKRKQATIHSSYFAVTQFILSLGLCPMSLQLSSHSLKNVELILPCLASAEVHPS